MEKKVNLGHRDKKKEGEAVTDNRTNEPTEAQGVAATVALARSIHGSGADHEDFDYYRKHVDAALVAAAGAVPVQPSSTVDEGKIAEVIAKATYDWSQQRLEFWRRPASVESPGDLDQYIARAVVEAIGGEGA